MTYSIKVSIIRRRKLKYTKITELQNHDIILASLTLAGTIWYKKWSRKILQLYIL